jgi:hypothetical protein
MSRLAVSGAARGIRSSRAANHHHFIAAFRQPADKAVYTVVVNISPQFPV